MVMDDICQFSICTLFLWNMEHTLLIIRKIFYEALFFSLNFFFQLFSFARKWEKKTDNDGRKNRKKNLAAIFSRTINAKHKQRILMREHRCFIHCYLCFFFFLSVFVVLFRRLRVFIFFFRNIQFALFILIFSLHLQLFAFISNVRRISQ